MSEKYTKYSNPWRKKVADIYDIPEEEMMMAKKEQVIDFERGVKAGMTKLKIDLISNPEAMIELLKMMSDENINKVLDEFCEPVKEEPFICTCATCRYKDTPPEDEPCHTCKNCDLMFSLWTEEEEDGEESEDSKA